MAKKRILLIDDDPLILKSVGPALVKQGYEVTAAESGRQALDGLETSGFDLALVDLIMEDADGFQVLKAIKKLEKDTMIMIMTGHGEAELAIECLRLGVDEYILKPCDPAELFFRIRNCLDRLEDGRRKRRAEIELQERQSLLAEAQQLAHIGHWIWNSKVRTLYCTDAVYGIFGIRAEGLRPATKRLEENIHPDDLRYFLDKRAKMLEEKRGVVFEHRIVRPDGQIRFLEERAKPTLDKQKDISQIIGTVQDITERREIESAFGKSGLYFSQLFEQSTTSTCLYDPLGTIVRVHAEFCRMFGVEEDSIIDGRYNVFDDQAVIDAGLVPSLKRIFQERKADSWETDFDIDLASASTGTPTSRNGRIFLEVFGYPILDCEGNLKYTVLQHYDITERKKAEEQIQSSLKEKGTLLEEIHHRIKNNMAVLSSLLGLQAKATDDEKSKAALMDSRHRVQSMSTIHESLYSSNNLTSIDLDNYLSKLAGAVSRNYTIGHKTKLSIRTDDVIVGFKQASTLGLIVNELITNSYKYAFPGSRKGEIALSLLKTASDQIVFTYRDNGIGMPKNFNWYHAKSLGLNLIKILVEEQLDGSIELKKDRGICFVIRFQLPDN